MNKFLEKLQIRLTPRFIRRIQRIENQINSLNEKINFDYIFNKTDIANSINQIKDNSTLQDYTNMQKQLYEDSNIKGEYIVGNYDWHENYPYETFLLYENGDIRKPIFENFQDKIALDFACGPGRMINRMKKIFKKVDGCDIAQRLLDEAKIINPQSDFYVTSGNNLGNTKHDFYDFIYCTISMQHIACHSIRKNIVKNMHSALKENGKITLQLAYNRDVPYTKEKKIIINDKLVIIKEKIPMANYISDDSFAKETNGMYDVGIGENDLQNLKNDFINIFGNCKIWFSNVSNYYKNLNNTKHNGDYWATDWIYINCLRTRQDKTRQDKTRQDKTRQEFL